MTWQHIIAALTRGHGAAPCHWTGFYPSLAPLPTLRAPEPLQHQILLLADSEQRGAIVAANCIVLVGDVLAAGGNVREDAAERQISMEAGAARSLEQPCSEQTATLGDHRRVEF